MTISVKTRFEVFKRDRFTCSYCGKHPPNVLLEADHITPLAAGGTDDLANLTTACQDCNRGKGPRLLQEGTAPAVNRAAVHEMADRVDQAKQYMELLGTLQAVVDQQVSRVTEAWAKAYSAKIVERDSGAFYQFVFGGTWPDERSIRQFLRKLDLDSVLDAVDITASRIHNPGPDAVRYFYGVCHRSIREGREPLAPQIDNDGRADYMRESYTLGIEAENSRLRDLFLDHAGHGFESIEDVAAAIWPTDV